MKYNLSSQGISIINNGKDRYISNGQDSPKVEKNSSKSSPNLYASYKNSKSIIKFNKKILNNDASGLTSVEQIDINNCLLVQSLMESSCTRQIVADFAELDECYYRDGLL